MNTAKCHAPGSSSARGVWLRRASFAVWLAAALTPVALVGISTAATTVECVPFQTTPVYSDKTPKPPVSSQGVTTDQANSYLTAVDQASARVITGTAATSVQGRPLRYAIVGRESNVTPTGLARIRQAAQQLMDPETSPNVVASLVATTPAILWVSGNVHGNEKSGADASLNVLYELADRNDCVVSRILDNAIVVILPIQNPDGREANTRRNAYGFDMNRDWFARTQPETDGKLELLRQYPPVLYIDAHEFGYKNYFFPPNADPVYHEVPDKPFLWINDLYSVSISAEMDRQRIQYFHGAPYDLFAVEYGDTVPTVGFHAAGMTFEKYSGDKLETRVNEHFVAMWTSLFAGASNKQRILNEWHQSYVEAKAQGVTGALEANGIYFDGKALFQDVPNLSVENYFFPDDPARARELAQLIRRLQRMDVKVWQLQAPLDVGDFRPYGGTAGPVTLPKGSYWVPMAQAQKHWIQAMLHEDPYIPVSTTFDVTAWSSPLLMNVAGGFSGELAQVPQAQLVGPVAAPALPGAPSATRIGLFEIPGSTTAFEAAGAIRYLFNQVWGVPYTEVTAAQIKAGLQNVDVLLVPDGAAEYALQALGSKGKKALADWVQAGGRYVGYLGGTELAAKAGVSTVVLHASHTSAPGTLIRVKLDPASPLVAGLSSTPEGIPTAWVMYVNDDRMEPGLGVAAATFPAEGDPAFHTSGLAIGVDELAGSAAIVDERVGDSGGRAIVFSFDPNFRGWSTGTQRLLWNALYGTNPPQVAAVSAAKRIAAVDKADHAAKQLPGLGKAIRIVVRAEDADLARSVVARYGAEFKELRKSGRVIFLIENRQGLSWEEHPFALDLSRELAILVTPISFSVP